MLLLHLSDKLVLALIVEHLEQQKLLPYLLISLYQIKYRLNLNFDLVYLFGVQLQVTVLVGLHLRRESHEDLIDLTDHVIRGHLDQSPHDLLNMLVSNSLSYVFELLLSQSLA